MLANLASCVSSRFREILSQVREGVGAWGCPLTLGWGKEGRRVGALKLLSHQAAATASSNQAAGATEAIILPTTPLPPNSSFTSLTVAPRGSERLGNLPKVTQAESGEGVMWDAGL